MENNETDPLLKEVMDYLDNATPEELKENYEKIVEKVYGEPKPEFKYEPSKNKKAILLKSKFKEYNNLKAELEETINDIVGDGEVYTVHCAVNSKNEIDIYIEDEYGINFLYEEIEQFIETRDAKGIEDICCKATRDVWGWLDTSETEN